MTIRQARISSKLPPPRTSSILPGTKIMEYQGIETPSSLRSANNGVLPLVKELRNFSQLYPDHDEYSRPQGHKQPCHPLQAPLRPAHPDRRFTSPTCTKQ